MKVPLPLVACLALTWQAVAAAQTTQPKAPAPGERQWFEDAKGCKFLLPPSQVPFPQALIEWNGDCVDGLVSGSGELRTGVLKFRGDFSRGHLVKGAVEGRDGLVAEGNFVNSAPHGDMIVHMPYGETLKVKFDHGRMNASPAEISWPNGAKYRGEIDPATRRMQGKGILEYGDGSVYEGEFSQDRVTGAGVFKKPDGETRSGTFLDGRLDGKGRILYANQARYEGELRAGEPNGVGRLEYADGSGYEGAFVSGKYQGKGRLKYADGSVYEGEFLAGELHGTGTLTYVEGLQYVGQFLNGRRHGTGRVTSPSGITREGEWKADSLHGKCRIDKPESVYEGNCVADKASGSGRLKYKTTGVEYEGGFLADLFEGAGTLRGPDLLYEGAFKGGLMEGEGVLTVGRLSVRGNFSANVLTHGTVKTSDGRTFEIDREKAEIFEVQQDGTKRPLDALPPEITI